MGCSRKMDKVCMDTPLPDLLNAITTAAAELTPAAEIGSAIGLSDDEWRELARQHREPVQLSIAKGRTQAQIKASEALIACAKFGKIEAALYALKHYHGWGGKPTSAKQRR